MPSPVEEEDTQQRTIYSPEHAEGIEVDDRPQQPAPERPDTAGTLRYQFKHGISNILTDITRTTPDIYHSGIQR